MKKTIGVKFIVLLICVSVFIISIEITIAINFGFIKELAIIYVLLSMVPVCFLISISEFSPNIQINDIDKYIVINNISRINFKENRLFNNYQKKIDLKEVRGIIIIDKKMKIEYNYGNDEYYNMNSFTINQRFALKYNIDKLISMTKK